MNKILKFNLYTLILMVFIIFISGCCEKLVNKSYYNGTVKVPADAQNQNGIIAFKVRDEIRKALVYRFNENQELAIDSKVKFRVAQIKGVLVARDIELDTLDNGLRLNNEHLIELHNGVTHSSTNAHTRRHIVVGSWDRSLVRGNDQSVYNIGRFKSVDSHLVDTVTYAVTANLPLEIFWQQNNGVKLFFNVEGRVEINGKTYERVDAVAILHEKLPH